MFKLCLCFFALWNLGAHVSRALPDIDTEHWLHPPEGVLSDDWLRLEMNGQRIGWTHIVMANTGNTIRTTTTSNMRMKRMGTEIEVRSSGETLETVDGDPISFESSMQMARQPMITRGEFLKDGKVRASVLTGNQTQEYTFSLPEGIRMAWGASRQVVQQIADGKSEGTYLFYSPDIQLQQPIQVRLFIGEKETITVAGEVVEGWPVRTVMLVGGMNLPVVSWFNDELETLRTEMTMGGMQIVGVRVTQEEALADFEAGELFVPTLVEVDRGIPEGAQTVIYEVMIRGEGTIELPETPAQKVQRTGDGAYRVTAHRVSPDTGANVPTSEVEAVYLESTPLANFEDEAVMALAIRALGQENLSNASAYTKARALNDFVHGYISRKGMETGYAGAGEVARTRMGDCTEHAVLLVALARAADLPARGVIGLLYVPGLGGKKHLMGFHMWAQIRIGEQWVDFDPKQGGGTAGPDRLALATMDLADASAAQMGLGMIQAIGNMRVSIVEVE